MSDPTNTATSTTEVRLLKHAIARLRTGILMMVSGLLCGAGLMIATLWLVVLGGDDVGQHLGLLGNYFPGYEVSVVGSLIGFAWAALTGALLGGATGWIYNRVIELRDRG